MNLDFRFEVAIGKVLHISHLHSIPRPKMGNQSPGQPSAISIIHGYVEFVMIDLSQMCVPENAVIASTSFAIDSSDPLDEEMMILMKRHLVAKVSICGILAFAASATAVAWGFQGQGGLFSPSPQQQTSDAGSTQAGQNGSQQSVQLDSSPVQSLAPAPVLTPLQSNQRQQDQNMDFIGRSDRTRPEPPVELSEFQRLVASSVGRVLPIYGSNLFRNAPSTFAPVNRVPVTPDYVIGPGDELLIHIWGQVTLDGHFTVDRSGAIYIPQVGTVNVSGIPFSKITDFIKKQVGRNFENFDLNVNMGQLRSIQIFVVGEAQQPGSYTVSSLSTLVNAIFSCGGPTPTGSMRNIQLKRGKDTMATFDLYDLLLKGDTSRDVRLASGDVIYIPPVGPMVALAGSIDKPAIYELRNETTVKDVVALSGGLATLAHRKEVRIERVRQHEDTRSVMDISLDDSGFSTPLADGDILEISPIIDRFKDSVTLRGNVANPRRFAWFPGMRVRDLIPDKEALLTRDYWEQRNQLGLPILDSTPDVRRYAPDSPIAQVNGKGVSPSPSTLTLASANANDNDTNVFGKNKVDSDELKSSGMAGLGSSTALTSQATRPTDTGTAATTGTDTIADSKLPSQSSTLSGASIGSAVTETARRFPVKNSVVLSAPEIDWAYAVIERLDKKDLTTTLRSFNLGRAILDDDESQNLELEAGDVVTIFSNADIRVPQDQQTKFVRLEGEFAASGIYRVLPNENLRQLVARAGGLSQKAYLYGSEFTRESARAIQQQRLDQYTDELDKRIKLAEANSFNNVTNPQDQLSDVAALQTARSVEVNLRRAKASGRIVLYIRPDSASLNDIPELPLEDGDTFIVPQLPLSVGVFGAVYTQNQFLYDPHRRASDYVRMAGGGTRTADTGRSYIIRADGSIINRQFSTALFTGNFESTHLYPGDAIVVPEQVDKRPLLRNLVDIATIVGQFGLGIAAIDVLR